MCDCDILRRASVKADLFLLRGGGVRPKPPNPPWERAWSKSAGGYAACVTFQKAKEEGCKLPSTGKMQTPLRMLYVNCFRMPTS